MRYFKSLFGFPIFLFLFYYFFLAFKQQRNRVMLWLNSFGYVPAKKGREEKNIKNTCLGHVQNFIRAM